MLDQRASVLSAETAPRLPVEQIVRDKAPEDVAALLPRLFNLCRAAQSMAARRALGLVDDCDAAALRQEILRDHVLRLVMVLPGHFCRTPVTLPQGWQNGGAALARALFGPTGRLPSAIEDFEAFRRSDSGIGPLLRKVEGLFRPGEAVVEALPFVCERTAHDPAARVENSCAGRVQDHPVVKAIARTTGRGPLWRVAARAYDLQAILDGRELTCNSPVPGTAQVPATRGLYAVWAQVQEGRVAAFARVTPTDHLQAPGGVLQQSLSALPVDRASLAPLLIDILDPCTPIRVREARHA